MSMRKVCLAKNARHTYHRRMRDVIKDLGGPAAVARMLGIKAPSVIGWRGRIPDKRCPAIERATNGAWLCEVLCPEVIWSRIPDPTWPHPAGRPVIDPARAANVQREEEVDRAAA